MKKKITISLLLSILVNVAFADYDFYTDGLYYRIITDSTVYVVAPAQYNDYNVYAGYVQPSGNVNIPETVSYNSRTYYVTGINTRAFSRCYGISHLTIGKNVRIIGSEAFDNCQGITGSIDLSNVEEINENAFLNCRGISGSIDLSNVKSIGHSAFDQCINVDTFTIGVNITNIGSEAFTNCTSLSVVNWNVRDITTSTALFPSSSLLNVVNFGDSVQKIPQYIFNGNTGITTITFSSSITEIGPHAFHGCSGIANLQLPNVKIIGAGAFYGCSGIIGSINLLNVKYINANAFNGCSGITGNVNLSDAINIGDGAFYGCSSIDTLRLGPNVSSIGAQAFEGCSKLSIINWDARNINYPTNTTNLPFRFCDSIRVINFGDSVQQIPANACNGFNSITTLTIGKNIKRIGNHAFQDCSQLSVVNWNATDVTILTNEHPFEDCLGLRIINFGNSVANIPENLFYGCAGLRGILDLSNIRSVGNSAFEGCGMDTIVLGENVTSIGNSAFRNCSRLSVLNWNARNVTAYPNTSYNPFSGCPGLRVVNFGDSVQQIPTKAFCEIRSITTLSIGKNVESIGSNAFSGCYNITGTIDLSNVEDIDEEAFHGCSGIDTILLSDIENIGASAFYGCSGITGPVDLSNAENIGYQAFRGCSGITGIIDLSNVESLGEQAFYGCSGISGVVDMSKVKNIKRQTFYNCSGITGTVDLSNVEFVGREAFKGCGSIDTLTLGGNVNRIDSNAFQDCSQLSVVNWNARDVATYPSNTDIIPFKGCLGLRTVSFGDSVQQIPAIAFYGHSSLTTLKMGRSISHIGGQAFANCDNILSLDIPNAPVAIGGLAFMGCSRLVTVNLGDSATSIGNVAFANCFRMNSFTMGNAVTRIGGCAFEGCVRLPMPILSASLTYIGESAFKGCSQIQGDILFPQHVDTIGNNAFAGCGNITSLKMKPLVPPTIFAHTFDTSIYAVPVYVPCNSYLQYYVTDYWENFPNLQGSQPFEVNLSSNNDIMGEAVMTTAPTCADHHTVIAANAYSGFHFVRWSDGSTSNPRHLLLAKDTTLEAVFAVNNAYITVHSSDSIKGSVSGSGMYVYNAPVVLRATPNNGYHFLHWSDGNTSNPRYLSAIQDSSFTAIFVSNISTVNVFNNNPEMGTVSGGGLYYYQNYATLTATPHYGYHFNGWNDGNIDNPRVFMVDRDVEYTASFAHNLYAVAVNSENSTMGYVEGGGNYVYNMLISIQATPNYGYHFAQWNDGNTQNPRTITVTADSSFTAQFSANTYQLFVSSDNPDMGSAYGAGSFTYNAQTTIAATPNYGYHFTQWSDGNTENPRIVTITRNTEYKAQFAINFYTITANSSNPAMGSTSGGGSYNYNSTINLSATPNYGYHFTQWSDGNTQNPRSVTVMQNAVYTAQFAINSYAIQVNTNNSMMGSVTGSGSYIYNTTADITATPNYGYHFVQWNDGSIDNPKTVIVTQDAVFTAQFDYNSYLLTAVSSDAAIGSVTGGGLYNYNSVVLVTATPNEHYHFVQWNDSITDNPRTIFVTNNLSLTAQFAIDQHILTVQSGQPTMGTTNGGGTYSYGEGVYIHAVPNYGYHFVQWSDGNTQNPRRVVVGQDTSFTALFEVNIYSATVRSNDSLLGTVCCSGSYPYRTQISLSATPAVGHHFVQWDDGNTENPRPVTLVQDTTLTGQFAVNVYTLSVGVNDTAMGYATGSGNYDYLSNVTISATARPHHHFLYWSDGSTSNPRQITITDNLSLYAQFEEDAKYTIHVLSMDTTMGCTSGSGQYYVGTQVDIAAEAKEHYRFTGWTDGVSDNPRRITVLENANFVALFEPLTYEIIALSTDNNMGTVIGGGMYSYGSYAQLQAQPNEGYHFVCWNDHDSSSTRFVLVEDDAVYVATFAAGVSVAGHTAKNVSLYPNPTTDMVYVASDAVAKLEVLDLTGRVLLSNEGQNSVSMRGLPSGVYLVRIHVADAVVCRRVVKR